MNCLKKPLRILLAVVAALQLAACAKTVQWEEEVPLNTGETIWVQRTDTFRRGSEPGNPLKSAWWPNTRAYKFSWHGQIYTYETKPKVLYGPILIYVETADKSIALVDSTMNLNCVQRGYGEYRWANGSWQLQQNVNRAIVGQPRNLMAYYSSDEGEIPARVDKEFKQRADTAPNTSRKDMQVDESRIAINCSRSK